MSRRLATGSASDLGRAERDIRNRIGEQPLDFGAMAAVSNIYRAANAVRNHLERKVLADEDLSWAAFTVLFVLWIWGEAQTRHLAAEAGVTKGTLTGVLKTLEKRGLIRRRAHEQDGRLVLVSLETKGVAVIERLFPAFNDGEAQVSNALTEPEKQQLASLLRTIIRSVEELSPRAAFEHQVTVRWRDTDALGHVNHVVFLTYLEEGRDAFYARALGTDPIYVVARIELDLRTEVRHRDAEVRVRIEVERVGTTSLTTRETIVTSSGQVAAHGRIVTVRWNPDDRTPIPFTDAERMRLKEYAVIAAQPSGKA